MLVLVPAVALPASKICNLPINDYTEKMTDSLKLAEMQRTSIEFERQRHLANWFIKSSQHMATPPSLNPNGANTSSNGKAQKSSGGGSGTKNGTITTSNPLFFIVSGQKPPQPPPQQLGASLALSRSQIFTSQTNLPLQIVTSSAQDGHKPKLRRFNSHDTSANMFSVSDFENARLARRNEIEMKQRQQQRLKMNSLSSGGDCSTGDSKGSKYSNESQPEPLPADTFLDRYSLPRVVRISHKPKFSHETLQSSSSNGSSSTSSSTSINNKNGDITKQNGELYLLYRYLRQRKIYHGFNTKSGSGSRKKGVMIPQEFPGYFSLVSDKGTPTATLYTSLVQLVRERVYKFISVDNLPAFTESQNTDAFPPRAHYIKSTARGGQIFRLLAVFEDGKQESSNAASSSKSTNISGREKEKGRYAQLLNENRQILYVSLTTKGKFYEIEPGVPQILQKSGMIDDLAKKKINPDSVHRLSNLITTITQFPINLKFISGPSGTVNLIPENLTITRISTENVLIACPIENVEARSPLHLRKLHLTPDMTLIKCYLGFENEQRMLANQNVQNLLKFCQFNCDNFTKMIEFEMLNRPERSSSRSKVDGLKILKPLNFPKLLRREKSSIAHEKEDSIIFLSKNDLANLESKEDVNNVVDQTRISDKMKVFQPSKKKWFKKSDKHTSLTSLDIDVQAKRMSMERYHDMSKLLQERFGDVAANRGGAGSGGVAGDTSSSERPTSEIGCPDGGGGEGGGKAKPKIQKSLSLQDVDFIDKPDLVPFNFTDDCLSGGSQGNLNHTITTDDGGDSSSTQLNNSQQQQQSFISEKMYSEFHVKTRQYSKSSSSLHQLLHFAIPQRMNISETKKPFNNKASSSSGRQQQQQQQQQQPQQSQPHHHKKLEFGFNSNGCISNSKENNRLLSLNSNDTIIDDLPYSSVRDSLLTSDDFDKDAGGECSESVGGGGGGAAGTTIIGGAVSNFNRGCANNNCNVNGVIVVDDDDDDDTRENIYAEICHDGGAISRVQINVTSSPQHLSDSYSSDFFNPQSQNNNTGASIDNIYNTLK